jgi:hypothetical protein
MLLLTSTGEGRWAWWRVDGRSGQTVGVMDNGYNQALVEDDIDRALTENSNKVGMRLTRSQVKNATPEQIADWARKAVDPGGTIQDITALQQQIKLLEFLRVTRFM